MYAGMHPDPLDPDFETLDLPRVAAGDGDDISPIVRRVPPRVMPLGGAVILSFAIRKDPRYRIALLWPILLVPVLGLIPFSYQRISTVADHYNYMPLAAVAVTVSYVVARSSTVAVTSRKVISSAPCS